MKTQDDRTEQHDTISDKQTRIEAFKAKREARLARLRERAEKKRDEIHQFFEGAKSEVEHIPFGQPILVDHYSAPRHRRALTNFDNKMRKSVEAEKYANSLESRIKAAESNSTISSDDPEAIDKLRAKLAGLRQSQELMKSANRIIRANPRNQPTPEKFEQLAALGIEEPQTIFEPDFCGRIGFARYSLQNNSANIKQVENRIKRLEERQSQQTTETMVGPVRVERNVEDNRVRLHFPDKPSDELRSELKRSGYRWSPRNKAWQAFLGGMPATKAEYLAASWEA